MLLVSILFSGTPCRPYLVGGIGEQGGLKMASGSTTLPAKVLILIHTVQLKPMIKAHFSGKMESSGVCDVAFVSVHSEKTRLKELLMIFIIITTSNTKIIS